MSLPACGVWPYMFCSLALSAMPVGWARAARARGLSSFWLLRWPGTMLNRLPLALWMPACPPYPPLDSEREACGCMGLYQGDDA